MKASRVFATLATSFGVMFALSAASRECLALNVYFNGSAGTDFLNAANWTPAGVPGNNLFDTYGIDDGLSSILSTGDTLVNALRVGSVDKTHSAGSAHFGRLTISGGSLGVIGTNTLSI